MFFLGLCAVFQITFLPGILILEFFKLRKGFIQTLVSAFGLSLIVNHLLVFLITSLSLNITYTFYVIFICEIGLIIWLFWGVSTQNLESGISHYETELRNYFLTTVGISTYKGEKKWPKAFKSLVTLIIAILVGTSLWWAFKVWITNIDTVFTQWDAIVSWNHWANEWYSGLFPTQTSHYAQLIPTNFAVTYAFLQGTQVQIFAKSFMPLFNLFILGMMLDLGLETKNSGYMIGLVATRFILKKFLGEYISSGYVDVALAFFALIPIYVLIKAQNTADQKTQLRYIWLGGILSAGTALTKQNGLFIFFVYPILAYFLVVKKIDRFSLKEKTTLLAKIFLVSLAIILPWYLFNQVRILTGDNASNLAYLIGDRHDGRTLTHRFTRAVDLLDVYVYLYPLILVFLPFLDSTFRWISLTILIPYSLIWVFAFSIFPRNLSIALPYLGMVTGICGQMILEVFGKLLLKLKVGRIKIYVLIIFMIIMVIIGGLLITDARIIDLQTGQQKEIIISAINHQIYDYFDELGHFEPIMTNYPIQYLPGLENLQIDIGNFGDYEYYQWTKDQHPEVRLMLIFEGRADDTVFQEIQENIENGNYELIFKQGNYLFVRIIRDDHSLVTPP